MADESYSFQLDMCVIQASDVVASGPGKGVSSGEPVFLDLDFTNLDSETAGGVHINVGTDSRLGQSAARGKYAFDTETSSSDTYKLNQGDKSFQLEADFRFFAETGDEKVSARGTLKVEC